MADIHDLQEERHKKQTKELIDILEGKGNYEGIDPDLDITKIEAGFNAFVLGGQNPDEDELSMLVQDSTDPSGKMVGVVRMTRAQWKAFTMFGDAMLQSAP